MSDFIDAGKNNKLVDPSVQVEFNEGGPFPPLVPQKRDSGIRLNGVFSAQPRRFVLKKAHLSLFDNRIFDVVAGKLVYISHHVGKNPLSTIDPLDLTGTDSVFNPAGEWKSLCEISAAQKPYESFKIRPKKISRHGRQYVKLQDDSVIMNIAKISKIKTMSLRSHFMVGRGDDEKNIVYKCKVDVIGRTISIFNEADELVAQIKKTNSAMIKTAMFGSGSESTIDVAPGVDCSTILAIVYGIGQVGKHYIGDAFKSFIKNPIKAIAVNTAVDVATDGAEIGVDGMMDGAAEIGESLVEGAAEIGDLADAAGEGIVDFIFELFFG